MSWLIRILILVVVVMVGLIQPPKIWAAGEFGTNYDVSYDVHADGITAVNEDITVKNLTDKYFASDFNLAISADNLTDLLAKDAKGPLEVVQTTDKGKTTIHVKFSQQIVGQEKEYKFNLKFNSPNFAQNRGKVWQVSIPRAPQLADHDQFLLKLSVPVSFGDPTSISPVPMAQNETNGKINYLYDKTQIQQSGVMASFGTEQWLDFKLDYPLSNNGILPEIQQVPIPADTVFQQVTIGSITPTPENVTIDEDGNYLAWFKVAARQRVAVEVTGQAHLNATGSRMSSESSSNPKLAQSMKYWETTNPLIKDRLNQILATDSAKTNQLSVSQKAQAIDRFVANFLSFDQTRWANQQFNRLGAVTALNNPDAALSNEYVDLFVTLARAANIPAQRVEGYAYSTSSSLQPTALGSNLHVWAEYADPERGWVMVDPTWENTTGGVDYFGRSDLGHLAILTLGQKSVMKYALPVARVEVAAAAVPASPSAKLAIETPDLMIAGFPLNTNIRALNSGNVVLPSAPLVIKSGDWLIPGGWQQVMVPALPPYGKFGYNLSLRGGNFWQVQSDLLAVSWQSAAVNQAIRVVPFYQNQLILGSWIGFVVICVGFYLAALSLHLTSRRKR